MVIRDGCLQCQSKIWRVVLSRGWYTKLSGELESDGESVANQCSRQIGQVDLELPGHPLPGAQQRYSHAVASQKLVHRAEYVAHGANRVCHRVEQATHEDVSGSPREHVQTQPARCELV